MKDEIIQLQNNAVEKLILSLNDKNEVTFKAPTGSGKTYMMADFMNRMLKDSNIIFLVSSLSKGDLALQNYEKFMEYNEKKIFSLNPYLIESTKAEGGIFIPLDFNVYILPRDLYKKGGRLMQGAFLEFLEEIKIQNKKIYLIKDECHIATNNLDGLKNYFYKTCNFSATPKLSKTQKADIQINEIDAVNTKLIKEIIYGEENDTLEDAMNLFLNIKEQYKEASEELTFGNTVNPCMIIQISNKEKANEEIENIMYLLNQQKFKDLHYMLIVDNDKECKTNDIIKNEPIYKWKEYAKKNYSTIDIIIFKMVISEGWDIPRACMLYQIRDSKSKQLDEQVIGRVRRNPKLLEYENLSDKSKNLVTKAYVWGIIDKENKTFETVQLIEEVQNEIKLKTTKINISTNVISVNLQQILQNKKKPLNNLSIFALCKKYKEIPKELKEISKNYIDNYQNWFQFTNNLEEIIKMTKNVICDYDKNMQLYSDENDTPIEVSLPLISYYSDNGNYINISDWIWKRIDENENFSFDSESEKEWCEILLKLINEDAPTRGRIVKHLDVETSENIEKHYLIGKNYLPNSEIKYEYYSYGIHSSYPDFIMKDYKDRIHIFETKSLNKSNSLDINKEEYEEKIEELMKCYQSASELTEYYFYIPIKTGLEWRIFQFYNGNKNELNKREFIKFFKD